MRAGQLNRYIDIERFTITQDEYGEELKSWEKLASRRPAQMTPVAGDERFTASQFIGRRVLEFRVRWTEALSALTTKDRIIYPATSETPADTRIFDIQDCREIGFREGLQIFAVARQDA